MKLINAKDVLVHGAKKKIEELSGDNEVPIRHMMELFKPDALEKLIDLDNFSDRAEWFKSNLLKSKAKSIHYPMNVLKRHGLDYDESKYRVIIGTIHSVKGGEADNVLLYPDLSGKGLDAWYDSVDGEDSILRTFYVGMTRAKRGLYLAAPANLQSTPHFIEG